MSDPEIVTTIAELRARLDGGRARSQSVGFVPTMGFLHDGHASLMRASVADTEPSDTGGPNGRITVVSIFVNPLQFAPTEDLDAYPRDLDRDLAVCGQAGVDLVFVPSVEEMYPDPIMTTVSVAGVSEPLEGRSRPTHFAGVATVVAKLFNIVGPCTAYFGEKDWQQLAVVRRMVLDLSLPVRVVGCPINRDPDGLARSSRNVYLTAEERAAAPSLRRALDVGVAAVKNGETDALAVARAMAQVIDHSLHGELDYAAAVQADTLIADGPLHDEVRLLLAVGFSKARLIDNDGCWVGSPAQGAQTGPDRAG